VELVMAHENFVTLYISVFLAVILKSLKWKCS